MKNNDIPQYNNDVDSVISSNSFVLNIASQHSLTNPYDQSKTNNPIPTTIPKELTDLVILDYPTGSRTWIFVSVLLTSFYYGIVSFLNVDFICTKVYQSFSIGLLILIDKLFFIKDSFQEDTIDEVFNNRDEPFLSNRNNSQKKQEKNLEKETAIYKEVKVYIIVAGVLIFICELSIFYILKRTQIFHINASLGLMVLGIELFLVKLNQTLVESISLINLLAMILSGGILIATVIMFLDYTFLFLGVIVSVFRYVNLFIFQYLRYASGNYNYLPWINFIDFILGIIFFVITLIVNRDITSYKIGEFMLILIGTFCYYFNLKFFNKQNK